MPGDLGQRQPRPPSRQPVGAIIRSGSGLDRVQGMAESEFNSPRVNLYVSSAGFSVEVITGRHWPAWGIRYSEGDRSMLIDSEVLATPHTMMLISDSIKAWDAPNDTTLVTGDDRARIIANVQRAFDWQGASLKIV
jgi:hypothetical protein